MSARKAACIICDVPYRGRRAKGFTIDFGMPPDFAKVDGDSRFGRPVCV
jgi:hypothetical protein